MKTKTKNKSKFDNEIRATAWLMRAHPEHSLDVKDVSGYHEAHAWRASLSEVYVSERRRTRAEAVCDLANKVWSLGCPLPEVGDQQWTWVPGTLRGKRFVKAITGPEWEIRVEFGTSWTGCKWSVKLGQHLSAQGTVYNLKRAQEQAERAARRLWSSTGLRVKTKAV